MNFSKKILAILSIFLAFSSCTGQDSKPHKDIIKGNKNLTKETREIHGYEGITIKGSFDVVLMDEPQGEILIKGEENIIPWVQTKIDDKQHLVLNFDNDKKVIEHSRLIIYIPVQNVKSLKLKGSGDITNKGSLKQSKFKISLQGSGDIELKNLIIDKTDISLKGSGNIKLSGVSKTLEIDLKGSGDILAENFVTDIANVEIEGSGDVNIYAKETFSGTIKGSGDIVVKGNPDQVSQSIKGTGEIQIL